MLILLGVGVWRGSWRDLALSGVFVFMTYDVDTHFGYVLCDSVALHE